MSDLIEREQVIDALDKLCDRVCQYSKKQRAVMCGACPLGSAFDVIEELPQSELVGHWKVIADMSEWGTYNAVCSNCGEKYFFPKIFKGEYYKVCPKCGSRMERE